MKIKRWNWKRDLIHDLVLPAWLNCCRAGIFYCIQLLKKTMAIAMLCALTVIYALGYNDKYNEAFV
jgi:hypothetical protein